MTVRSAMGVSRPRSVFVVAALGATLVFAFILAFLAQTSATYQRAAAERVLRDYAALAADQYVNRAEQRLATAVFPVLNLLTEKGIGRSGGRLPEIGSLAAAAGGQAPGLLHSAAGLFRLALADQAPALTGIATNPSLSRWIADSVGSDARTRYHRDWYMSWVWGSAAAGRLVAVYALARDSTGAPSVAYGLLVDRDTVARLLKQAAENAPLLPPSLTGGRAMDSVAAVRVLDPVGGEVFASDPRYASSFRGVKAFDPPFGAGSAEVTLRPTIAPLLIIGGLPRSRLPIVLGLLGLTGILVTTAIIQLRREQELARLRGDFVASVSHELRTPLAQIRMFTETLLLGRVRNDEERSRSLEILDQEARRLSHLVDNLLFVARGERNRLQLHKEDVDLGALLHQIAEGVTPLAAARRVVLVTDIRETAHLTLDPSALRQIVLNLIDNALKYGPPGATVTVGLDVAQAVATIRVDDQGAGVPPPDRERIWERFTRLDRDVESAVAGSGIGLAIVRELTFAHGGQCSVTDGPGGGSRFMVALPR